MALTHGLPVPDDLAINRYHIYNPACQCMSFEWDPSAYINDILADNLLSTSTIKTWSAISVTNTFYCSFTEEKSIALASAFKFPSIRKSTIRLSPAKHALSRKLKFIAVILLANNFTAYLPEKISFEHFIKGGEK